MWRLFFCLFCLLCHWTAQAAPTGLIAEKKYLKDATGNTSIENIGAGDFRAFEGNLQLLFEAHPVWIRLTLQTGPQADADKLSATGPQVLRIGPHALDNIELYERVAGKWVRQIAGDKQANTLGICPDDYHCFALNPERPPTEPVYLRIVTTGLASVDTNVLQGNQLMAAVTSRVTMLAAFITIALGLLCIGIFLAWSRKTLLFFTYCLFQFATVVFLATNTGLIARILPMYAPETHNFVSQASLIARYFFVLLVGWVLLAYHQPTRTYQVLVRVLFAVSAGSMTLLILGHVQTALLMNMLNFYLILLVQLYGIFSANHLFGNRRHILLVAYGTGFTLMILGIVSTTGGIFNFGLNSTVNTGGDWRLNGLFVGVFFFLIIFAEDRGRYADRKLELEALRLSSEQSRTNEEKLKERSALIDMLTHELKNPLGTIQFSLAALKRALSGDAESQQRVHRIDLSLKRMDDLIEHVADSNKIDRTDVVTKRERLPARALVQELLDEYPTLDRFDVHIQDGVAFLADRKMLAIILENLLSNAWKYSVEGTKIAIAVTLLPSAKASGESAPSDAGWTCFEISNEVAVDQVPDETRLFERYYRHSGVQGLPGMGIGLSLVQSAAAKLSATVSYQSQGSHVFFKLRMPN